MHRVRVLAAALIAAAPAFLASAGEEAPVSQE